SVLGVLLNVAVNEEGNEGSAAVIYCPYNATYTNYPKYFCKGPKRECKTLMKIDDLGSWVLKGRLNLNDNTEGNKLVVTINNLSLEDEGEYGCGVSVSGPDLFIVVNLTVIKVLATGSIWTSTGSATDSTGSSTRPMVSRSLDGKEQSKKGNIGLFAALLSALFWLRWKRQSTLSAFFFYQNAGPSAKDDTYAALDPAGRTSEDVYHTLT
ncbi:polymeric immunoglobulin receptor-like, partial [Clarias magur]